MNVFFDLDGTLLDSRERLYHLFQALVNESHFSFEQYWDRKRNKIGHKQILQDEFSYSSIDVKNFEAKWMQQIELPEWLALDKPIEGATDYLNEMKKKHRLYIVTARQSEKGVFDQIGEYGWFLLFDKILVTKQREEKFDLIKKEVIFGENDWIVGDTGYDIEVGKKLGIKTAAVLSGFLNCKKLKEYHPDLIIEDVTKLNV